VSQLSRNLEAREDKVPRLADLRESGQLEQDADAVLFLHRPVVYDEKADPGEAHVIVAKHRNGPTGLVRLVWLPKRMRFADPSRREVA
jgi:replicative DNA helicase